MEVDLDSNYSWVIAYINRDFINRVEKDLNKFEEYKNIKAYIPTIRILRKQFKGKDIFEEIPFLFNYGFFKIPNKNIQTDFLKKMKDSIPCIHAWIKDIRSVISNKPSLITGKEKILRDDINTYAVATNGEISRIIQSHKNHNIYGKEDLDKLSIGSLVTLKGYPFEGMDGIVRKIDLKSKKVKIELRLEGLIKEVGVSFDNILYTVYHGLYDENDFKEKHIEEIKGKGNNIANSYTRSND